MDFLLNNSIFIVFTICAVALGYIEYRQYLKRRLTSGSILTDKFKANINDVARDLLVKLLVSVIIAFVISLVSFRELWMNDTFHIVFLTNILYGRVSTYLKHLVK